MSRWKENGIKVGCRIKKVGIQWPICATHNVKSIFRFFLNTQYKIYFTPKKITEISLFGV